jgi:hypothetical protein
MLFIQHDDDDYGGDDNDDDRGGGGGDDDDAAAAADAAEHDGDDSNHTSAEWYTRVSLVITCPNASCGWICSYVTNTPPAPPFTNPAAHRTIASPSPG